MRMSAFAPPFQNRRKKVIIRKPDLDTCLTALILGISDDDGVSIAKGDALREELEDPNIICIEAGGSGQTQLNNFDHHDPGHHFDPACRQACLGTARRDERLEKLVDFVCRIEEGIPFPTEIEFPSLSSLFSGLLFFEPTPEIRFRKGIKLLESVILNGMDPFDTMPVLPEWKPYVKAKIENQASLQDDLKDAQIFVSNSGKKIGFLKSRPGVIGGSGALYKMGCDVAILFASTFGNPPVRKFTIAGNHMPVIRLLDEFQKIEPGWGGRETIFGSPATGTKVSEETVLELACQYL